MPGKLLTEVKARSSSSVNLCIGLFFWKSTLQREKKPKNNADFIVRITLFRTHFSNLQKSKGHSGNDKWEYGMCRK